MRGIVAEAGVQVGAVWRPPVPVSREIITRPRGKRFPCTERANSIHRPAARNQFQSFMLEAEWKGISDRGYNIVSGVEGGTPPVAARGRSSFDARHNVEP